MNRTWEALREKISASESPRLWCLRPETQDIWTAATGTLRYSPGPQVPRSCQRGRP